MKLITRDTDYAVRALCYIVASGKQVVSVPELIAHLKIPRPFLRKILQILTRHAILKSFKGPQGGFQLGRYGARITLAHLIRVFQGSLELNECFFKREICPNRATCPLRKKVKRIEQYAREELQRITIGSLLKKHREERREG